MWQERTPLTTAIQSQIHGYDLDGALLDSFPVLFAAFNQYSQGEYGIALDESFVRRRIMPGTGDEMIGELGKHLAERGERLKRPLKEEVGVWQEAYRQCDTLPTVYDGAVELLALSRSLGKKIPLITGGFSDEVAKNLAALQQRQEELGIEGQLWDGVVMYEDMVVGDQTRGKPDPWPMQVALASMGLAERAETADPRHFSSFYFGDSASDMLFARNIGGTGILVETMSTLKALESGLDGYRPPIIVRDASELYEQFVREIGK